MNIILIAVALSLDASGVSMAIGCGTKLNFKKILSLIFSFGFFQFLLAFMGGLFGSYINNKIIIISDLAGGFIILTIGLIFFYEGFKKKEACIYRKLTLIYVAILGISVSIDALGVGFSVLHKEVLFNMFQMSIIIGIITAIFTSISLYVISYLKKIILVEKFADFIAGFILIIFGINMIL